MIGKQQIKPTSRTLAPEAKTLALEGALLFLLGALALFLHARFRTGMNIPGQHGLEFMALLLAGRMASKVKFASLFMALGMGCMIMMPFMGFKNPVAAVGYILPVFALDLIYSNLPERLRKSWVLALVGGISYMLVPIFRILLMGVAGMAYPAAVKYGTPWAPIAGFFTFGLLGAGITAGFTSLIQWRKKKNV